MRRETLKRALLAMGAVMLDPPGWIPAWSLTGALLWYAWRASSGSQAAMEVLRVLSSTYQVTLGIWLGYKGVTGIAAALSAAREAEKDLEQ